MKRKRISTTERLAILKRHASTCHMCNQPIAAIDPWDVSHEIPLELGGADDKTNWKPAHRSCHRDHTAKVDVPAIAKAKRREAAHLGAVAPRQPIRSPGFKPSPRRHVNPIPALPPKALYR